MGRLLEGIKSLLSLFSHKWRCEYRYHHDMIIIERDLFIDDNYGYDDDNDDESLTMIKENDK